MTDHPAAAESDVPDKDANELVKAVDQLVNELGPKFTKISSEIFARMDEMSRRLDEMEAAIQAGNDTRNDRV